MMLKRWLRFRLRTLFVLLTLVAGCLWLWRCGGLDYEAERFPLFVPAGPGQVIIDRQHTYIIRTCRVCNVELLLDTHTHEIALFWVQNWYDTTVYATPMPGISADGDLDLYHEQQRARHPWNTRSLKPWNKHVLLRLQVWDPIGSLPPVPGSQALEALLTPYHLPRPVVDFLTGR